VSSYLRNIVAEHQVRRLDETTDEDLTRLEAWLLSHRR